MNELINVCQKCGKEKKKYKNGDYCPRCQTPPLMIMWCYNLNECLDNIEDSNVGFKERFINFLKENNKLQIDTYVSLNRKTDPPIVSELFTKLDIEENEFLFELD